MVLSRKLLWLSKASIGAVTAASMAFTPALASAHGWHHWGCWWWCHQSSQSVHVTSSATASVSTSITASASNTVNINQN